MYSTGVGSGDTVLIVTANTAGDTSQSLLCNFSVASEVSSSALGVSLPKIEGNPAKKTEKQAKYPPSCQSGGPCAKQPQQHLYHSRLQQPEGTLCKAVRTVVSLKRRKPKEVSFYKFPTSTCSSSKFPIEAMVWFNEVDSKSSSSLLERIIHTTRYLSQQLRVP